MSSSTIDTIYQTILALIKIQKEKNKTNKITEDVLNEQIENGIALTQKMGLTIDYKEIETVKRSIFANIPVYEDPGIMLSSEEIEDWFTNDKEKKNIYWERYRNYLLNVKKFPPETIETLEKEVLPKITNQLGNPKQSSPFSKKGLVIGNIQSGKTSNYLGLICNAADSGYKIIILLSGTIENLRRQTQERVEEGFVGFNKEKNLKVGIGLTEEGRNFPISLTTTKLDFVANGDNNSIVNSIGAENSLPYIFVVKKNVKVLQKLYKYFSGAIQNRDDKISVPMLMIDDEADNASINTNDTDLDPTHTNEEIRKLLSLFSHNTYVGYTATPFANVFILPDSKDALANEDLFPKDFIYFLDVPKSDPIKGFNSAHYIGPELVFNNSDFTNGQNNDSMYMVQEIIDDDETLFPMNHKKTIEINRLFPSFYNSIRTFLLSNAIRDLRKDKKSHRSMLINMSRFIDTQKNIAEIASNYLKNVISEVKSSSYLDKDECMKNKIMISLFQTWNEQYEGKTEFSWDDIIKVLYSSIKNIKVVVVNSSYKDQLKYADHKDDGLRVIAVGGLALSRGLTLEGLTVSYFYRNTQTYDVLMQMGRWFGYRPGYADLCRLWITEESCNWYEKITQTISKLRSDMYVMNTTLDTSGNKWKPLNFGIRIWCASNDLGLRRKKAKVTAANKMQNTAERTVNNSYFGLIPETRYFSLNLENNNHLISKLQEFCSGIKEKISAHDLVGERLGAKSIPMENVVNFLDSIRSDIHLRNISTGFDISQILDFIRSNSNDPSMQTIDVVFIGGSSNKEITIPGTNSSIHLSQAGFDVKNNLVRLRGVHTRLGSKFDTNVFLEYSGSIDEIQESFFSGNIDETFFLKYRKKPLLLVYFIEITNTLLKTSEDPYLTSLEAKDNNRKALEFYNSMNDKYLLGLAIGFQDDGVAHHQESYIVNVGADYYENNHFIFNNNDIDEIQKPKEKE